MCKSKDSRGQFLESVKAGISLVVLCVAGFILLVLFWGAVG